MKKFLETRNAKGLRSTLGAFDTASFVGGFVACLVSLVVITESLPKTTEQKLQIAALRAAKKDPIVFKALEDQGAKFKTQYDKDTGVAYRVLKGVELREGEPGDAIAVMSGY